MKLLVYSLVEIAKGVMKASSVGVCTFKIVQALLRKSHTPNEH